MNIMANPVRASQPLGQSEVSEGFQPLRDATIMIVDDEPITMEIVKAFLEEAGYQNFVLMEDSKQVMGHLEKSCPDILLVDLIMPDITGFDIISAVRDHQKLRHLPVVMLTASSDASNKLTALDLGATDFLSKPVDPSELVLRVRNTLAAKAYMDQLAFYDPVTHLPNRHMFMERLEWSLNAARREQRHLAVISIELDQFNRISDTLGVFAGDEMLCRIARRIEGVVRNVDALGHFRPEEDGQMSLFRFERGLFSLLLHGIKNDEAAARVANRLLRAIREPLVVEGTEIYITASIGIASYPTENQEPTELLRLASNARDYIKSTGGDALKFSSGEINTHYKRRLNLESHLRKALENKEFVLHFQPKVSVRTGAVTSVEALIRWQTAAGEFVSPGQFIPLAEETGLIVPIGEWAIHEACRTLKSWMDVGMPSVGMAVNLSSVQFDIPDLPQVIRRIARDVGMDPKSLILEITESMLLDDIENKIKTMHFLKEIGLLLSIDDFGTGYSSLSYLKRFPVDELKTDRSFFWFYRISLLFQNRNFSLKEIGLLLSIDDFGTGYSSLSYLKRFPVDELKIDRSFLMDIHENPKSRAIFSSVIYLAKKLGLKTVAEGVETEDQLRFVAEEGCDVYQGFFFSRPAPADTIRDLLSRKAEPQHRPR